jgi:hypothetical protein
VSSPASQDAQSASAPPASNRNVRKLLIIALPVLALAAALILWLSSDTSLPPLEASVAPPAAPAPASPAPREPTAQLAQGTSAAPPAAPTLTAETSRSADARARGEDTSDSSARRAPRLRVYSNRPADAQQGAPDEAEWALPASGAPAVPVPSRPGQPRVAAGSNGAPIFD